MQGMRVKATVVGNTLVVEDGVPRVDVVLRVVNLSPLDWLQPGNRKTTMEHLFDQYSQYRNRIGARLNV